MGVTLFQQEDYNLTLPRFLKTWHLGIKGVVPVQNEKRSFEIPTFYAQKWLRNYYKSEPFLGGWGVGRSLMEQNQCSREDQRVEKSQRLKNQALT